LNIFKSWESGVQYYYQPQYLSYVNSSGKYYINSSGKRYSLATVGAQVANVVAYRGEMYYCIENNNDVLFDASKWVLVKHWSKSKSYNVGDYVLDTNLLYKCKVANSDLVFNPTNWYLIID
jgi:hypothetical protein